MVTTIPRRVCWSSTAELHQIFILLFDSPSSSTQQEREHNQLLAINRIKVWVSRGSCPHEIESTANLLELILRDSTQASGSNVSSSRNVSQLELRLSYSMALTRFVNTLLDPLQQTYYARSLTSIAERIGLPTWLVELRHSATHEDLPGLNILREGGNQALDYLYSTYWLPLLSPSLSTTFTPLSPQYIATLQPLIKSYKQLSKLLLRDISQKRKIEKELVRVYKGFEKFVNGIPASKGTPAVVVGREACMEAIIAILLEEGGLVPLAKKKRPSPRQPSISPSILAIWVPLINKLEQIFDRESNAPGYVGFVEGLVNAMTQILMMEYDAGPSVSSAAKDRSYDYTLIAWILYFLSPSSSTENTKHQDEEEEESEDEVKRILAEEIIKKCFSRMNISTNTLLEALIRSDANLAEIIQPLLNVVRNSSSGLDQAIEADEAALKLEEMERRLAAMEQMSFAPSKVSVEAPATISLSTSTKKTMVTSSQQISVEGGWRLVEGWKACPIGALSGRKVASLDL